MIWGQIGPQKLTNNKKSHESSWLFAFTGRNGGPWSFLSRFSSGPVYCKTDWVLSSRIEYSMTIASKKNEQANAF
jgi:hypothetical protein